jgi:DNA polymerase III sliding clamp (beta) subunit (PCNA family)
MKFEINSGCLTTVIKAVKTGGHISDILWIKADNKGIQIKVPTREELTVSLRINNTEQTDLKYVCYEPGFIKVNTAALNNILKKCEASQSVLIHHIATNIIAVLSQDVEAMVTLEYCNSVMTSVALDKPEQMFAVERDVFVDSVRAVNFAKGHNPIKPYFNGIFVEASKNKLRCFAGMGSFFAIKETKSKLLQSNEQINIFLPGTSIGCIVTAFSALSTPVLECKLFCKGEICVLSSGYLELRIEKILILNFPGINEYLMYDFPNKLCVRMSDLRTVIKSIQAAADNAHKHGDNSLCVVDITVDTNAGNMLLTWGAVARGNIPLTVNTVFQTDKGGIIELRSDIKNLSLICKSWRTSEEITIFYDKNKMPIVVRPSNKEATLENESDAVLSSMCKKKMPNDNS